MNIYMHVTTINKKGTINLKESKEGLGSFDGGKGKEQVRDTIIISKKIKNKNN